jgi:cation diffusion facilitator family transporter
MHAARKQLKTEKKALNISLLGGLLFVILEIIMAFVTRSQAVLLDAVYDGVELFMILISLTLIPLLYKPSNEKHPFGYLQIESLFVVIKGFMMVAVTIGLIMNNAEIALHGGRHVAFGQIAYFELFATLLSLVILILLNRKNRALTSPLVDMEIQEWKIDACASLGMSAAFFLPVFITADWFSRFTPYLDQVIAIILSLFMLPTPIRAVITGLRDLFLLAPEEETVEAVKQIVTPILEDHGYHQLYYDIVRTGRKLWISVYITFEKDLVSIRRFQALQSLIIRELSKEYQDFYFELLPDIEFEE